MTYGSEEKSRKAGFWKTYFIVLAIFLTIGLIPSLRIVMRNGLEVLLFALPENIVPQSLREESISDILAEDWITYPKSSPSIVGREGSEILLEFESSDPQKDIVAYYKEAFKKQGYDFEVESQEKENTMIVKAQKGKIFCNIRISREGVTGVNVITVVLSKKSR